MDGGGEAICETCTQQTQPLRCRSRNIPASTKLPDLFMQQGPVKGDYHGSCKKFLRKCIELRLHVAMLSC